MSASRRLTVLAASALALGGAAAISASPASAATPACGNTSLTVSATGTQGATGHANFVLRYRNRTATTCTIYGYPGLDALSSTGHVLAHAARTLNGFTGGSRHGIPTVVLHPGGYASADVEWMNFNPVTSGTCTIYGYPGLDALSSTGHVLAHAARTLNGFTGGSRHGIPTVVLHPGGYASADVEWMNFNPVTSGTCTFSHSVATTPANTSYTVHLARSVSLCRLQVHPTVPGLTGNY